MNGTPTVPFSELFADTIHAHGIAWAHKHYTKRGMSRAEFGIWLTGFVGATA